MIYRVWVRVLRCCGCVYCMFWVEGKTQCLVVYFRSRLLVYSAGSGVNRVQVVLSGFSMRLFCPGKKCRYVVCIYWLHSCLGI